MKKILRATYDYDMRFMQVPVFEYSKEDDSFFMLLGTRTGGVRYPREVVSCDGAFRLYELCFDTNIEEARVIQMPLDMLSDESYLARTSSTFNLK